MLPAKAEAEAKAEALFCTKSIPEIRRVKDTLEDEIQRTQKEIEEHLDAYGNFINSTESITLMKDYCHSISSNIAFIKNDIRSLSSVNSKPMSSSTLTIARGVRNLVDSVEHISTFLEEFMFLEAMACYMSAQFVYETLLQLKDQGETLNPSYLTLIGYQWEIVKGLKVQILQQSRKCLREECNLPILASANVLASLVLFDGQDPKEVLKLFLESKNSCLLRTLSNHNNDANCDKVVSICKVLSAIQINVAQVGELFVQVSGDTPLFYKVALGLPPAPMLINEILNSFGDLRLWEPFKEKLDSVMLMLDKNCIASTCSQWLREFGRQYKDKIFDLIEVAAAGRWLSKAEMAIRETMESKEVFAGSLEWLKSVFGSEIDLPWPRIREVVLGEDFDLWDHIFEDAFVRKMKVIIDTSFEGLSGLVNVTDSICKWDNYSDEQIDILEYRQRPSSLQAQSLKFTAKKFAKVFETITTIADQEFMTCCNELDKRSFEALQDLLRFLESPKGVLRSEVLTTYLQDSWHENMSIVMLNLSKELDILNANEDGRELKVCERCLFIGGVLSIFQFYSKYILGSPRDWVNDTYSTAFSKLPFCIDRHTLSVSSLAHDALTVASETANPQLEEFNGVAQNLCVKAHRLWIFSLWDKCFAIFSYGLQKDGALLSTTPSKGWKEIVVQQEQLDEGLPEKKISLPSKASTYVVTLLNTAFGQVDAIGSKLLVKTIPKELALELLKKVVDEYENFSSTGGAGGSQLSEKVVLQLLFDVKYAADRVIQNLFSPESYPKQTQDKREWNSKVTCTVDALVHSLSRRLDSAEWLTYEPYLWENVQEALSASSTSEDSEDTKQMSLDTV